VIGGEGGRNVVVALKQVAEIPRAVPDVELRVQQVGDDEPLTARADRDPACGVGEELHQSDRARRRAGAGIELALGVDDGREERRIEVVVLRMAAHDRLVAQRVPHPVDQLGPLLQNPESTRGADGQHETANRESLHS